MSISAGLAVWKTAFQISPIILSGGIASFLPGQAQFLPLSAVTELINTPLSGVSGLQQNDLDNFFANFQPVPGGTIIQQDVAHYPFANQSVAANAVIRQPNRIAMLMICPVRGTLGYFQKLAIITALQAVLSIHNNAGGTYVVATPSYIYTNCIMLGMRDVSNQTTKQPQSSWLLEFEQPLITLNEAQAAQSSMMQALSSLTQVNGEPSWSGPAASTSNVLNLGGVSAGNSATVQGVPATTAINPLQ